MTRCTSSVSSLSFTCISCLLRSLVILFVFIWEQHLSSSPSLFRSTLFSCFLHTPRRPPITHSPPASSSSSCCPVVIQVSLPNCLPFCITLKNEISASFCVSLLPFSLYLSAFTPPPSCLSLHLSFLLCKGHHGV